MKLLIFSTLLLSSISFAQSKKTECYTALYSPNQSNRAYFVNTSKEHKIINASAAVTTHTGGTYDGQRYISVHLVTQYNGKVDLFEYYGASYEGSPKNTFYGDSDSGQVTITKQAGGLKVSTNARFETPSENIDEPFGDTESIKDVFYLTTIPCKK